ncbi:unnamed protein product [Effrenium voratum]|uniref:Uncharacterized protein n=1 Tax=Effrenium voratum TaxID=2562239 RepID=A0AA36IIC2_9DINO|nr:unnamed protein product [Effrenium voratum]
MRHPKCPRLVVRLVLLAPSLLLRPVAVPLPAVDAAPLLRQMAGTRSRVNLVQVGACDGDFGEDASSNDPVQGFLLKEPKIHGLLVEANPNVCATLSSKVSGLFDGRVSAVNCAVVPGDSAEDAAFFVVSPRLAAEQPRKAFHWALYQLSSLDRAHVEKHHVHLGLSKQHFARYVEDFLGSKKICGPRLLFPFIFYVCFLLRGGSGGFLVTRAVFFTRAGRWLVGWLGGWVGGWGGVEVTDKKAAFSFLFGFLTFLFFFWGGRVGVAGWRPPTKRQPLWVFLFFFFLGGGVGGVCFPSFRFLFGAGVCVFGWR